MSSLYLILSLLFLIANHCTSWIIQNKLPTKFLRDHHDQPSTSKLNSFYQNYKEMNEDFTKLIHRNPIYLVGMMGSGKSSIGKKLSYKLNYGYIDTDDIAVELLKMPISEYFAQGNQEKFRDLETKILQKATNYCGLVISTGGGILERPENIELLRRGITVFIDVSCEDIYRRFMSDPDEIQKRPLLRSENPLEKLKSIYESRKDKYLSSDVHVPMTDDISKTKSIQYTFNHILGYLQDNPKTTRFSNIGFPKNNHQLVSSIFADIPI